MNPVRILVAEDEAPQRDTLLALLQSVWPEAYVVAACSDGLEAIEAIEARAPEVAFLDIRMPGLSGLEVAEACSRRTHVVFVTAHDDYAVRAFEQGAVDYLLKPLRRERLAETVLRLKARIEQEPANLVDLLTSLRGELGSTPRPPRLKWITASIGDMIKLYAIDDVLAFHAQDKYTRVLTTSDEAIIRKSLRELLSSLDQSEFWQVHRSVIVRVSAVDCVKRDELGKWWLTLKGHSERLPVSSAFQGRLRGM
ncbi:MAG TPA: LytTR family DNA-binding domain-containing protein [Polyangiaceae bacterium]|nr:LytTR family DNA-binding domain-containing protein [Polyangiaceae bacterium]